MSARGSPTASMERTSSRSSGPSPAGRPSPFVEPMSCALGPSSFPGRPRHVNPLSPISDSGAALPASPCHPFASPYLCHGFQKGSSWPFPPGKGSLEPSTDIGTLIALQSREEEGVATLRSSLQDRRRGRDDRERLHDAPPALLRNVAARSLPDSSTPFALPNPPTPTSLDALPTAPQRLPMNGGGDARQSRAYLRTSPASPVTQT